jgi:DNA primase
MAGRIPQSFVDNLLDRADIVELIDSRVKLKKSGKNYMACCPFHDEKSPSFSVNAEKQFYHCFGCGASGNAIGFLMEYEHQGFPEAVEYLAQKQGMQVPRESGGLDPEQQQLRLDVYGALEKASRYYQEQLRSHVQANIAQDYLKGRGLTGQIAHQFGIGYAPPGWDNLLKFLGADEAGKTLLSRAGMLVEKEDDGKIYDRFRHRIMFPIRDVRGRVIGFGGRVLNDDKPKYLNSPETEVFHKGRELYGLYEAIQANRHLERILVVEGYMDVVALAQYGVTFATATLGTAASDTHLEKAFRHAPEVVFCFDGDEAGIRAARRALEVSLPVLSEGRQVRFMFLPAGEDPDTLIRQHGKEDFLQRMKNAMPLSEFLFQVAGEALTLATPEGRAGLITNMLPSLRRIPQGAYQLQLKNLLAHKSQTDICAIDTLLEKSPFDSAQVAGTERLPDGGEAGEKRRKFVQPNRPASALPVKKLSRLNEALDEVTALLLKQPALVDQYEVQLHDLGGVLEAERLLRLADLWRDQPGVSLGKILETWQKLYGSEDASYFYELGGREFLLNPEDQARQFGDILGSVQNILRQAEIQVLIDKAKMQGLTQIETEQLTALLKSK